MGKNDLAPRLAQKPGGPDPAMGSNEHATPQKKEKSQRSDSNRQPLVYKTASQKTQALKTQILVKTRNAVDTSVDT